MRVMCTLGVMLCLVAGVVAGHSGSPATDATAVLAAAREALGGDKKLAEVKSFTATGRTRQIRGNNLAAIEFEIFCELPDKYVRKDEIPAQESEPTSSGFNGEGLIQIPPPPAMPAMPAMPAPGAGAAVSPAAGPGATAAAAKPAPPSAEAPAATQPAATPGRPARAGAPAASGQTPAGQPSAAQIAAMMAARGGGPMGGPPVDPRKARLTTTKQDFAKLMLGMFAASFPSYPLTFSHIGQAEAPQGKADVIEAKGPGTFVLKLFINSETHLPIMVSWMVPATNVVMAVTGQPAPENVAPGSIVVQVPPAPAPTAPKEEVAKYAKDIQTLRTQALAGKLVENRIYYADYRDIGNGLRFPFRLRRSIAGETVEETNFDGFTINKKIDPRRFEALK